MLRWGALKIFRHLKGGGDLKKLLVKEQGGGLQKFIIIHLKTITVNIFDTV